MPPPQHLGSDHSGSRSHKPHWGGHIFLDKGQGEAAGNFQKALKSCSSPAPIAVFSKAPGETRSSQNRGPSRRAGGSGPSSAQLRQSLGLCSFFRRIPSSGMRRNFKPTSHSPLSASEWAAARSWLTNSLPCCARTIWGEVKTRLERQMLGRQHRWEGPEEGGKRHRG